MKTTVGGKTLILIPSPKELALDDFLIEGAAPDAPLAEALLGAPSAEKIPVEFTDDSSLPAGGYRATVAEGQIAVSAADADGRRSAIVTLAEIARQLGGLATGEICDHPGFAFRAVIEGYCGKPWEREGRLESFRFMARRKFNRFFSSTRSASASVAWREPFDKRELAAIAEAFEACRKYAINYVFSIRPADIVVSDDGERERLFSKMRAVYDLGVRRFMMLEDDVYRPICDADKKAFGDYGAAHSTLALETYRFLKNLDSEVRMVFCPVPYLNSMVKKNPEMVDYLAKVSTIVPSDVEIIWTGPYCCSNHVDDADADWYADLIGRKPFLWDNYPVVDGRPGVLLLGPVEKRSATLADHVSGYGTNVMDWPAANCIPVSTIAEYLWNPADYNPPEAVGEAIEADLGARALSVGKRIVEYFTPVWPEGELGEGPAGSVEYYLKRRGEKSAAEHLEQVAAELLVLTDELDGLTDRKDFVEILRRAVANLAVLSRVVSLDHAALEAKARGDQRQASRLEDDLEKLRDELTADVKPESLAALSFLSGNAKHFRKLVGDTSLAI